MSTSRSQLTGHEFYGMDMVEGSSSKLRAIMIYGEAQCKSVSDMVKVHMRRASEPITNNPDTNEQHTEKFKLISLMDTPESHPKRWCAILISHNLPQAALIPSDGSLEHMLPSRRLFIFRCIAVITVCLNVTPYRRKFSCGCVFHNGCVLRI